MEDQVASITSLGISAVHVSDRLSLDSITKWHSTWRLPNHISESRSSLLHYGVEESTIQSYCEGPNVFVCVHACACVCVSEFVSMCVV